jgi:copper transport protein
MSPSSDPARSRLAGTLVLIEAGVLLLLFTGFVAQAVFNRPPVVVTAGLAAQETRTAQVADLVISVSVTPNRPGSNAVTLQVSSSRRPPPAPVDAVELALATRPILLRQLEPGQYAGTAVLDTAGPARFTATVHRAKAGLPVEVEWSVDPPTGPTVARHGVAWIGYPMLLVAGPVLLAIGARRLISRRPLSHRPQR